MKGNIGHLEISAFLASLLKVCGIFEHGMIPPNVNIHQLNPAIKWDAYNLRVPIEPTRISRRSQSGRSLVSIAGSGIGGSNGHVVVESPSPKCGDSSGTVAYNGRPVVILAGGLTPRSTTAIQEALAEIVSNMDSAQLPMLSLIMGRRGRQMTWRSSTVYCPDEHVGPTFGEPQFVPRVRPPLAFVFAGQGPQHIASKTNRDFLPLIFY